MIFTAIHFAGPRCARSRGNREPDVRTFCTQPSYHRALANAGRAGKDCQPGLPGAPRGKRGTAHAMDGRIGRGTEFPALVPGVTLLGQISPPNSFSSAVR
jgi:hypothetical protein